ncbi:MAG: N-acetyltransferase [Thermomicrobiales bacterium]|nr:N-acetyltransferase [Thermomicrobiales bacterium]
MFTDHHPGVRIHPTADVADAAIIGEGTSIWHECQVRERARIGTGCILGKDVYVDFDVVIGDNCKLQNRASVYHGTSLGDGVFVGPHVVFTNDKLPRAINPDGSRKSDDDWEVGPIQVGTGASLGASSVILPGVTIGTFALIGSGSVVTKDVPDYGIVVGNPARFIGYACACGHRLQGSEAVYECEHCGRLYCMEGDRLIPHEGGPAR